MEWFEAYPEEKKPSEEQIAQFVNSDLWNSINTFLKDNYESAPVLAYSGCSAQPGWNVKYKKSGKSLCTLYPLKNSFIVLVVIGSKEYDASLEVLPECTEYTRMLFEATPFSAGGRWLMLRVENEGTLEDAKRLIQLRRPIKIRDRVLQKQPDE